MGSADASLDALEEELDRTIRHFGLANVYSPMSSNPERRPGRGLDLVQIDLEPDTSRRIYI